MKRTALITGAGRGIGLAIAQALAEENCDITVCDIQPEKDIEQALNSLRDKGADVLYCRADVSNPTARSDMISSIKERFGRLNVLVNNAGVAPKVRADILDATEESFERVMKINLQGPYFLTQSVANWMIEQHKKDQDFSGSIINIASISSTVASTGRGEYCISKAGVSMTTKLWATRLGEFDIPVYEIRPGLVMTDMTAKVKDKYDKLIEEGLLLQSRWAQPEDIATATAMLVRGDIHYATGQVLMLDGGLTLPRL
ncbi:MAG: 3-ketoacyl-ACP reductase [Kiritimatiellae bacterium]|nr:3-ketoacyl-ACP reductase [Kiritimatiellia bacterium]